MSVALYPTREVNADPTYAPNILAMYDLSLLKWQSGVHWQEQDVCCMYQESDQGLNARDGTMSDNIDCAVGEGFLLSALDTERKEETYCRRSYQSHASAVGIIHP